MNRTIEFRGKRADGNGWVYGQYYHNIEDDKHYILSGKKVLFKVDAAHPHIVVRGFEYFEVIPETVGQFIGLLNNDGKKIYEGDIITSDRYTKPAVVSYINDGFYTVNPNCCEKCENGEGCIEGLREAIVLSKTFEVIGNIYDNKELITD